MRLSLSGHSRRQLSAENTTFQGPLTGRSDALKKSAAEGEAGIPD